MSFVTYSLDEVAQSLACTTRWLTEQIRSGRFRARKIGRHWRMTDSDVAAALDACANDPLRPAADADVMPMRTGLTRRSHRRVRSGPW